MEEVEKKGKMCGENRKRQGSQLGAKSKSVIHPLQNWQRKSSKLVKRIG